MPKAIVGTLLASLLLVFGLFTYLSADDPEKYLIFGTWGTPQEVESFQYLVNLYNATRSPKHKVKLFHPENVSYDQRLLVQAAAGNLPDVMHLHNENIQAFVQKGLIQDLTPFVQQDTSFHLDAFFPNLVKTCTINNRLYGIPHNFSTLVLYYNKDHFDAEGLSYPDSTWDWNTLLHAAIKLTKRDRNGNVIRYGCNIGIILFTLFQQNGGNLLNESLDRCVIASPESAGALQFLNDLSEKYHVTWNSLATGIQWDDMFAGGRCSMLTNGRWAAAWYAKYMPQKSMDIAPLPRGKYRVGGIATHMMTISASSKKKAEAWEFIKFLVGKEGQIEVSNDGNNIPALREVAESDLFLKNKNTPLLNNRVFLDEVQYARDWAFNPGPYLTHYTIAQSMTLAENSVLLGYETPITALQKMQNELNRIIEDQKRITHSQSFLGSKMFYLVCVIVIASAFAAVRRQRKNSQLQQDQRGVSVH
ncbi:MAG: sugar ABC transporter substrate-binding protein [Bacteroidota bacterium]